MLQYVLGCLNRKLYDATSKNSTISLHLYCHINFIYRLVLHIRGRACRISESTQANISSYFTRFNDPLPHSITYQYLYYNYYTYTASHLASTSIFISILSKYPHPNYIQYNSLYPVLYVPQQYHIHDTIVYTQSNGSSLSMCYTP